MCPSSVITYTRGLYPTLPVRLQAVHIPSILEFIIISINFEWCTWDCLAFLNFRSAVPLANAPSHVLTLIFRTIAPPRHLDMHLKRCLASPCSTQESRKQPLRCTRIAKLLNNLLNLSPFQHQVTKESSVIPVAAVMPGAYVQHYLELLDPAK